MDKDDKRLNNLVPFKKGQSGNPAGMKKGTKHKKTILKEFLELEVTDINDPKVKEIEKKLGRRVTQYDLICQSLIDQCKKGNVAAIKEALERKEGKVEQRNKNENINLTYEDVLKQIKESEEDAN